MRDPSGWPPYWPALAALALFLVAFALMLIVAARADGHAAA